MNNRIKNFSKVSMFTLVLGILIANGHLALAATFPVSNIDVFLKSVVTKQVFSIQTDSKGNFTTMVPEENGVFDLFVQDESAPPVQVTAKKNVVSGRIVVLTEGTTTKDPAPVVVKKSTPKKTSTKTSTKGATNTTKK